MLGATIGECNNGDGSFHQHGADLKTANVYRASQAALKISTSGRSIFEGNIYYGGCAGHVDANGYKYCALLPDFSSDQREAMEQTTLIAYEKNAETVPHAEVLLVLKFRNFIERKHRGRDGTPVVTREVVTEDGMVVLSAVSKHLSLAPGDTDAVLSIVETHAALKAAGARVMDWRTGALDLEGLLADFTVADRIEAVLDFMEVLVTAEQEPAEYSQSLKAEKTEKMVQMVNDLRNETKRRQVSS